MDDDLDPLVPRPLDRPRDVPLDPDADLAVLDNAKILAAPDDPAQWPACRTALTRWRSEARSRFGYDDALYRRPDLAWAATCFVVSQVWLWDELIYDWDTHRFTPERLVADAEERFGGFDGIVLWHAYPVIGVDERNQWDYHREVDGLADLVAALHNAGIRVFVDYNPWDVGTHRAGIDADELSRLVADLDVDGVFLDTLKEGGGALLDALEAARDGVAVEGESTLQQARLVDHPLSWAQWFADSPVPGVVRSHLYERRHMMHHVRRWHRDHTEELQSAWLNGVGVMVWEVVFGVWVGWTDRDAELLRRMVRAQRALAHLLVEGEWTPLVDLGEDVCRAGVFGSEFRSVDEQLTALVTGAGRTRRCGSVRRATDRHTTSGSGRRQCAPQVRSRSSSPRRGSAGSGCRPGVRTCRGSRATRRPATRRRSSTGGHCGSLLLGCRRRPLGTPASSSRPAPTSSPCATGAGRRACMRERPSSTSGSHCRHACTTSGRSSGPSS